MNISNLKLMKIAAIGGFLTAGMGYALRIKLNKRLTETDYYQEAIKILQEHHGVTYLLGEPIRIGSVDVSDNEKNWSNTLSAHLEVPVKGPKQRGTLYFWANRQNTEDQWNIHRMELQLHNEHNRRLLIKGDVT